MTAPYRLVDSAGGLQLLKSGKCLLPFYGMVHDWCRLAALKTTSNCPRLVHLAARDVAQLRDVLTHVIAIGVKLDALADGIEHSIVRRGIGPAASGPLPTVGVGCGVKVE